MYDVITIGTATQDVFLKSRDFKVLKDERFITGQAECFALGAKIEVPDIFFTTGGGATNAAVTFARQGFKTAAICKVGKDASGQGVINDLRKEKAGVKWVARDVGEATAFSVILIAPNGERTILVHRGASEYLKESDLPDARDFKAKWFYVAPLGGENAHIFESALKIANKNGVKIAVNPSKTQIKMGLKEMRPLLSMVSIFTLNQEEAALLCDLPFKEEKLIFKTLDAAIDGIVVMTKGPKGVVISDGKNLWRAGTYPEKEVVDRTGAGDAFGSGFVAGLLLKNDIDYAIKIGSANATSKVEHMGAKTGLLYKKDLNNPRWKKLEIKKEQL